MEIMQQQSSNPLDSRWRGHVPLPYATHGMALPPVHDIRQMQQQPQQQPQQPQQQQQPHQQQPQQPQPQQQQPQRPPHHLHHQQQHPHQQQLQQQHHRLLLKQTRPQPADAGPSRGHPSQAGSSSSSLSLHASQTSPITPATGKSGGTKEDGEKKEGGEWEPYNAGAAFLGPTLWDKTISYDSDLKLEYMDLDEFLNENGIPVDEAGKALRGGGGGGGGGGPGNTNATNKGGNNGGGGGARDLTSPTISVSPEAPSPSSPEVMPIGLGVVPQGPPVSHPTPSTPAPPTHSIPPPCLSPDDSNLMTDDCCSSDSGSPHSPALQVHEGVPGQDFDPRTRMFSEDELKPQPMIKKSRKQFVPMELKDDKYWARRRKNNMAAKRSRDARRLKENQIAMRANFLERENDTLTAELQKAQTVVDALKKRLAVYEVV